MTNRRGTIRQRGRGFQGLIRHNGQQLTVGVFTTADEAQAEIDRWADALDDGLDPRFVTATIAEAIKLWLDHRKNSVAELTARADHTMAAQISENLLRLKVRDVTARQIRQQVTLWADTRQKSTATRYKAGLAAFFTWCVEQGARDDNPVHGVRVPGRKHHRRTEIQPFSRGELDDVVDEIRSFNPVAADQILFIALTGVRLEEARELRVSDLQELPYRRLRIARAHPEGGSIGPTKTKKSRHVPLTDEAWTIARRLRGTKDGEDLLLTTASGKVIRDKGFRRATRWDESSKRAWKEEADLKRAPQSRRRWEPTGRGRRLYDLRHTAATLWLEQGVSLATVAQWLGHASVTTTAIYTHWLGHDADRAALELLNTRQSDTKVTEGREA